MFLISIDMQPPPKSACNCACVAITISRRKSQSPAIMIGHCVGVNLQYGHHEWEFAAEYGKPGIISKFNSKHQDTIFIKMLPSLKTLPRTSTTDPCHTSGHWICFHSFWRTPQSHWNWLKCCVGAISPQWPRTFQGGGGWLRRR